MNKLVALLALVVSSLAAANNLSLIDRDSATGYELYRSGKPTPADVREYCRLGITEIMVLSGTAGQREHLFRNECPTLKVVYNVKQSTSEPLSEGFLKSFDEWVETARVQGKKIAFRCECGCHRTGRLAAYYQIKYQQLPLEQAIGELTIRGKWMAFYPHIYKQVRALADYIAGRACSTSARHCVRETDGGAWLH